MLSSVAALNVRHHADNVKEKLDTPQTFFYLGGMSDIEEDLKGRALARQIITRLGGQTKIMKATGIDKRTIDAWLSDRLDRHGIPPGNGNCNWKALCARAAELGEELSYEELARTREE